MNVHVVGGSPRHHRRISSLSADGFYSYCSSSSSSFDEDLMDEPHQDIPEDEAQQSQQPRMLTILARSSPEIRQLCKTAPRAPSCDPDDRGSLRVPYLPAEFDDPSPRSVKRVSLSPSTPEEWEQLSQLHLDDTPKRCPLDDPTTSTSSSSRSPERFIRKPTMHRRRSCDTLPSVEEILALSKRPESPPKGSTRLRNTVQL